MNGLKRNDEPFSTFQYVGGKGAPKEFTKITGLKTDRKIDRSRKSRYSGKPDESIEIKDKARREVRTESIADLEKQVLSKYGSGIYKTALENNEWDEDVDDDIKIRHDQANSVRSKFEGFGSVANKVNISVSKTHYASTTEKITSESEIIDNSRASGISNVKMAVERKSILLGRILKSKEKTINALSPEESKENLSSDRELSLYKEILPEYSSKADKNTHSNSYQVVPGQLCDVSNSEIRLGPLNVPNGYRLRKPPSLSDEEKAVVREKEEAKANAFAAQELEQKLKRIAKRELEQHAFLPFEFNATEFNQDIGVHSSLFTTKSFSDIGVDNKQVLQNLERMGIFYPTKIQELVIPALSNDDDILIQAQTGSGKTLAFLLPLLRVVDPSKKKVQAIIIAPSRELVTQIASVAELVFQNTGIGVLAVIGGANVRNQVKRLREDKPQIVVATPGRLAEIVFGLEKLRLGMVKAVVIDEVDNLLREPYLGELQTILQATPLYDRSVAKASGSSFETVEYNGYIENVDEESVVPETASIDGGYIQRRMVCFASATGNDPSVKSFLDHLYSTGLKTTEMSKWKKIAVESTSMLPSGITHGLISCPKMKAFGLLKRFLTSSPIVKSALVFVNDPHRVEIVCDKLLEMGIIAAPLHGESSKDDRKVLLTIFLPV